jgi:GH25 family lysozyme M1 (1,4-beta-N-acetylmuramidase)
MPGSAKGVDVSDFTGVNKSTWPDLRKSGVTFTGVKASEGNYFKDSTYQPYTRAATTAGLYVMPYVFADPYQGDAGRRIHGNGSGATQAAYAWNNEIGAARTTPAYSSSKLMLPAVLDIEADPYAGSSRQPNAGECYRLSRPAMVTWIRQFLTTMKSLSRKTPIIYTSPEFWARCTGNYAGFGSTYPLWIAVYRASSPPPMPGWGSPTFWQYTSSGAVRGISGRVDLDYLGPIWQASALGAATGPIQLQTLNALNAQGAGNDPAVTYSPQSLPPGLSVSSSGTLSGTPAVAGTYRVTIKAAGGVPAAISFTWNTPLAAPVRVASTVGVPAWVQVRATDAEAAGMGYPPAAFTVRGLPAGVMISSAGLITGWPYVPGSYRVTVSATDGPHVTASATFAWAVTAAADIGPTGTLRQHGGSDKCLNDPSSRTANGTPIDLATCTGRPSQAWTVVQDGTIRVLRRCLTASRTRLLLDACDSGATQQWHAGTDGSLVSVRYGSCLTGPAKAAASGTWPVLAPCANSPQAVAQQWSRPAGSVVSGMAAGCLAAAGSVAELVSCANSAAQHWSAAFSSEFAVQANGQCLTENGTTAGSAMLVTKCSNAASQHWSVISAGHIPVQVRNAASGLCLTVPAHSSVSGTALILGTCSTALNATWRVT